jgi:N-acetylmuramoyl-L-alanine amidase
MRLVERPSPNFNERRAELDMLVLHYTGMETGDGALERMCDPEAGVSAHYMVGEDGVIVRLVAEPMRAWHAGVSRWQGDEDLNSRSIGIEIVNGGHDFPDAGGRLPGYPDVQIRAVISLSRAILARHDIPQSRIVGHSDIAPTRKRDPGEHFPWARLGAAGIGLWPATQAGEVGQARPGLVDLLAGIGYDTTDAGAAITAFQRRFLPQGLSGQADEATCARAWRVAGAYGFRGP